MLTELENHCLSSGFSFESRFHSPLESPALRPYYFGKNFVKERNLTLNNGVKLIGSGVIKIFLLVQLFGIKL